MEAFDKSYQLLPLDGDEAFYLAKFVRDRRKIGFKEAYDVVMAYNKKES